jgi:nucleotide-binding universal stress UspA family protein
MKILLAYDGAEHSQPALDEIAKIAIEEENVYVEILSVVAPADAPTRFATGERPHAHEHVEQAHAFLRERGIVADMKVEGGDPAEKIISEAREGGYDLIVTGTRGRGPVARLLLGSVSHRLAEEAPCTLLVVSDDHRLRVEPRVRVEARSSG